MYLLRSELKNSFPFIGKKFGGKDHTTAIYAYKKILQENWEPKKVWVGYGDHMMFYTPEIVKKLSDEIESGEVASKIQFQGRDIFFVKENR